MSLFQLEICPDPAALIARGVELWQHWSAQAIDQRGRFCVNLSGGSTPKPYYAALALAKDIDWSKTFLCWGDERYVPADHPDSNFKMVKEVLLQHIPLPAEQILPFPTTSQDPRVDAQNYETRLRQLFPTEWPEFDLSIMGIGDDGHTASLFPGTAALEVQDRWVAVGEKSGQPRLTLTLPVFNHSRQAMFFVSGSGKAPIINQILSSPPSLPAQRIRPTGRLLWLLDQAAASGLPLSLNHA